MLGSWLIFALLLTATTAFGLTAFAPGFIRPPASVSVDGDELVVRLRGPYKIFALRSSIRVPLASVTAVRVESDVRDIRRGARFGTYVPGGTIAGTFGRGDNKAFWAVKATPRS